MRVISGYIDFCRRHLLKILVACSAATLLALFFASRLTVDAQLARLLPEEASSVTSLERLDQVYAEHIGRLTVVIEAGPKLDDPGQTLKQVADDLAGPLAGLEGVSRVEARRPVEFFEQRRLLYADLDDLQTARGRLKERIAWEERRANPLFVDVDGDPPPVELGDLADEHQQLVDSPYVISSDGRRLAVFVHPAFPAADLYRSQKLVEKVDQVVATQLASVAEVAHGLTGRYTKRVDLQQILQRDLTLSLVLALTLILGFLWFFLRSVRGTFIVVLPLVVGIIWAFAWAEAIFGNLNIMTAFLGAVLMGLGADYGIHLYSRYHALCRQCAPKQALAQTFASTGRAIFFSALTTTVALGSLLVSGFRAFYEFGGIALGGMLLILGAYMLLFPCLILLAERRDVELPPPATAALSSRIVAWFGQPDTSRRKRAMGRLDVISRVLAIAVVLAAAVGVERLAFDRDFAAIQSTAAPSWELDERVNELIGHSQTPAVVLTESADQARHLAETLPDLAGARPDGYTVDEVVALGSFVPDQQDEKRQLLNELAAELADLPASARDGQLQDYLDEIRRVLATGQIEADDLPRDVRKPFSRRDTDEAAVALILPAISLSDYEAVADFASLLRDVPDIAPGAEPISEALLLDDIITMTERDAYWILGITVLGLLLLSILAFRNSTLVIVQMTMMGLGMLAAVGINGLLGVDFNFLNIVILPIWIGLGVDAAFHILLHLDEADSLEAHIDVGLAIIGAYLTSLLGFATLLLARHSGLFSLGQIAVYGLGSVLVISILIQMMLVANQRLDGSRSPENEKEP